MWGFVDRPNVRAWVITCVFAAVGFASWMFVAPDSKYLLPNTIFYVVIVINTFFSVRLYSRIQPYNFSQFAIDALLIIAYIALALSMGRPLAYVIACLVLFVLAVPKYAMMLGLIPYDDLLRRKIKIDLTGVALCAAVLIGVLMDYPLESAWTLAIVFTLANIYLLLIKPMYRLPTK